MGVAVGVVVVAILGFWLLRRRNLQKDRAGKAEIGHELPPTYHEMKAPVAMYPHEAPSDAVATELATRKDPQELPAERWR